MSEVPPPPPTTTSGFGLGSYRRPGAGDAFVRGWFTALVRGLVAFVVMAAFGEIAAFVVYVVEGSRGSVGTFARLGWLYFGWFHHIALTASIPNLRILGGSPVGGQLPGGAAVGYHLGVALMLGTFLAIWLLYSGGKAVADRADGGGLARALHGLKIAPAYALPPFLISQVVRVKYTIPPNAFAAGTLEVKLSAFQSLLLPLVIAGVAGAAGGLRSGRYELLAREPWGRRVAGALAGGVRMLVLGLLLSFAGLLVMAVVMPDATRGYFAAVSEPPVDVTAVMIGHHVLVLPNQSMWVLVPAMGGCDGVAGNGVSTTFLCYWRFPKEVSLSVTSPGGALSGAPPARVRYGTAPPAYFLFLLVPALAVLLGGRLAARKRARYRYEAIGIGAAAGVVFAVLVAIAAWFASFSAGVSAAVAGLDTKVTVLIGPSVLLGGLIALVWGVVGGGVGGWMAGRDLPARAPFYGPTGLGEAPAGEPSALPGSPPPPGPSDEPA